MEGARQPGGLRAMDQQREPAPIVGTPVLDLAHAPPSSECRFVSAGLRILTSDQPPKIIRMRVTAILAACDGTGRWRYYSVTKPSDRATIATTSSGPRRLP
jgi:hypothetical protein